MSSPLQRSFLSLLAPWAPISTPSSSWRGPSRPTARRAHIHHQYRWAAVNKSIAREQGRLSLASIPVVSEKNAQLHPLRFTSSSLYQQGRRNNTHIKPGENGVQDGCVGAQARVEASFRVWIFFYKERGRIGTVARWRSLGVAAEQNTEMHILAFGGGSEGFRSIRSACWLTTFRCISDYWLLQVCTPLLQFSMRGGQFPRTNCSRVKE